MCAPTGNGRPVRSPETVRYQRRPQLPGLELRTVFDSARRYWFYCTSTGFELFLPASWRGEMWHKGSKQLLERGWVLAAHAGDMFASKSILYPGNWHALTIDARVLAEVGGQRVDWERLRLRPFTRMSARLAGHAEAVVQSIQLDPIDCVVANLRSLLVDVAGELVEGDGSGRDPRPPSLGVAGGDRLLHDVGDRAGIVDAADQAAQLDRLG